MQDFSPTDNKVNQPIHWGRFVAGLHAWNEHVEILNKLAQKENIHYNAHKLAKSIS